MCSFLHQIPRISYGAIRVQLLRSFSVQFEFIRGLHPKKETFLPYRKFFELKVSLHAHKRIEVWR